MFLHKKYRDLNFKYINRIASVTLFNPIANKHRSEAILEINKNGESHLYGEEFHKDSAPYLLETAVKMLENHK